MAGFFGFMDFTKPGSGVRRDEEEKKGIALFGQLLFRKFWNYMKLSMLYFVTCIPSIVFFTFATLYLFSDYVGVNEAVGWLMISIVIGMFISMFCVGSPFKSGYTYVIRNYVRQQHAWLWSDFMEHTKKNIKQSLGAWLVDIVFSIITLINIKFYLIQLGSGYIYTIMFVIMIAVIYLYISMQSYIWTMIVTFDLKLVQIYKNALIFSVLGLLKNLLSFIVRLVAFVLLFFGGLNTFVSVVLCAILFMSVFSLFDEVYSYPFLKKYMLDISDENGEPEEEKIEEKSEKDFDDNIIDVPEPLEPNDVATIFRNKQNSDANIDADM